MPAVLFSGRINKDDKQISGKKRPLTVKMYKAFLSVEGPHSVYAQKSDHLTCFTREVIEEMEILKSVDLISGNFQ